MAKSKYIDKEGHRFTMIYSMNALAKAMNRKYGTKGDGWKFEGDMISEYGLEQLGLD